MPTTTQGVRCFSGLPLFTVNSMPTPVEWGLIFPLCLVARRARCLEERPRCVRFSRRPRHAVISSLAGFCYSMAPDAVVSAVTDCHLHTPRIYAMSSQFTEMTEQIQRAGDACGRMAA